MKKALFIILAIIIVGFGSYYAFVYYVPYSKGYRAGELVKFSQKGFGFKTWEGQISQEATQPLWNFSVQDNNPNVIEKLKQMQGKAVKLTYIERYKTFPWLGETKYFITEVVETNAILEKNNNIENSFKTDNNTELEMLKKENEMLKQTIKDLRTTIEVLQSSSDN